MTNLRKNFTTVALIAGTLLATSTPALAQPAKSGSKPPAKPKVGTKWTSPDGLEMVWIPPGEFMMGSPESEPDRRTEKGQDEGQNQVKIAKGFWMDTTEVTTQAFQKFLLANPSWQKDKIDPRFHDSVYLGDWSSTNYKEGEENFPVGNVSWYAARAYCDWAGERLPTEAEWEYAARAGTTTAYWWGNTFDESKAVRLGSSGDRKLATPNAVGAPQHVNPWGLADMLGNVEEWTSSLSMPYPYQADDGRENPENTDNRFPCVPQIKPNFRSCRAVRGGSYGNSTGSFRAAWRLGLDPRFSTRRAGFRCVR